MASLSRTVEGWMGDTLYSKLGDQPNIERTWNLLRDVVGNHLLGSEFVPVPFIESAVYYNQLFVFTKKQSVSIEIAKIDLKNHFNVFWRCIFYMQVILTENAQLD